ncbi:MAG: lipid-binding SYLF domain-containing protein [Rubritepida sp.]|nr:lipid-binding SYLF domain-containing protein [Rubritepida sp.]
MRNLIAILLAGSLAACAGTPGTGEPQAVVDRATLAVQELLGNDRDLLSAANMLRNARAVMVCPRVFRAAFFLGGEGGGCVLVGRDGSGGWSSPAFYALASGNLGFQFGIQDSQTIIIIRSDRGLTAILDSQFKFGADASVAVAAYGGSVQGATTANLGADIVTVSRSRGLFAGVALDGTILSSRSEWNQAYYGQDLSARQIVVQTAAHNPGADPLRAVLARFGSPTASVGGSAPEMAVTPVREVTPRARPVTGAPRQVGRMPLPPPPR